MEIRTIIQASINTIKDVAHHPVDAIRIVFKNRFLSAAITAFVWMLVIAILSDDPGASIAAACVIGYINYVTNVPQ